ncbi:MAG: hypothetical protein ABSA11_05665 [Candidatus Bathyarchaeia archaeon]|jgi:hypothetical protein
MKIIDVIVPEIEGQLAKELHKSPTMIRFYACRMTLELELGRQMTPEEQHELAKYVYEIHRRAR